MKHFFTAACVLLSVALATAQRTAEWIRHAAISPDGSSIAFGYQGDIWLMPSSGGTARPLTIHEAYDYHPVWSPDGKSIAFASNRYGNFDVFLVNIGGGTAVRLTTHSNGEMPVDFTPDGKNVLFTANHQDAVSSQQFPVAGIPELYSVPIEGGRETQWLTTAANAAHVSADGDRIIFQDLKGYEDELRKHHTSSVTHDVWLYTKSKNSFQQISTFKGEDLQPWFAPDEQSIYYLSEAFGTMNVVRQSLAGGASTQITFMTKHPVRDLSVSKKGDLCFTHHGTLYTMKAGEQPKPLKAELQTDVRDVATKFLPVSGVSEFDVSPSGKEIAFVFRGEVFVASTAEGTTKRITNTPEQERSVDFAPDGRSIVYASERNGSWNLYISKIEHADELYFFAATTIKEEALLTDAAETFQPAFSPDGKEVAYLEERTALKVVNVATKQVRQIVPGNLNYSYMDGDQYFRWSPDGKWFLVNYLPNFQWTSQIGLVSSDGKGTVQNISQSGYGAAAPQWMMKGKMMIYSSAKNGQKNHASWGGQQDVYATFFTQEAWDEFKLNEEELALLEEKKKKAAEEKAKSESEKQEKEKGKDKDKGKGKDDGKAVKKEEPTVALPKVEIDTKNLEDRTTRLTIHSSNLSDAFVTPDGAKLIYMCEFEKGYDLWQTNLRTKETKILAKLGQGPGFMVADSSGKQLFVGTNGTIMKVDIEKGEAKPIAVKGEMLLQSAAEREYLFEHIWRQVEKKFYVTNLHNVDWKFYKEAYRSKLKEVNNEYDFAQMMSEMLGELNASHTGAFFWDGGRDGDQTASLGLLFDLKYSGDGLRISEVVERSPVIKNGSKIKAGVIIEKIDGNAIAKNTDYYPLLNHKAGKPTLLACFDPAKGDRWEETVKPIEQNHFNELLYQRWIAKCEHLVDSISGGQVGYVHVRGMDDGSYREVFDKAMGKHIDKKALIVDTRFNGGGWLHDDLATFLSGKAYLTFTPRDQKIGQEPMNKWRKPSAVVMNEFNYSDAHLFPWVYKELNIGPLVGMPVAGTGTAVWWEPLLNGVVFGIPQVGMVDNRGNYMENNELEPDVRITNSFIGLAQGRDEQLEKAVEVLLKK